MKTDLYKLNIQYLLGRSRVSLEYWQCYHIFLVVSKRYLKYVKAKGYQICNLRKHWVLDLVGCCVGQIIYFTHLSFFLLVYASLVYFPGDTWQSQIFLAWHIERCVLLVRTG